MIQLSIIVPVYNMENFITECFNSIFEQIDQSYAIEIIFVDNGSTDHSINILNILINSLDHFNKEKVYIVEEPYRGVSNARNTGIKYASGKYITFLDSDDVLLSNYFSYVLEILSLDVDILQFNFKYISEQSIICDSSRLKIYSHFTGYHNLETQLLKKLFNDHAWFSWLRIYKKTLFNDLLFPQMSHFEDAAILPQIFLNSKHIFLLDQPLYGYRMRITSATRSASQKTIQNCFLSFEKIIELYINRATSNQLYSIPLIHFFHMYIKNTIKLKGIKQAKINWKKFSSLISKLHLQPTLIDNDNQKFLILFINNGLIGFYLAKFLSKGRHMLKKINKPHIKS